MSDPPPESPKTIPPAGGLIRVTGHPDAVLPDTDEIREARARFAGKRHTPHLRANESRGVHCSLCLTPIATQMEFRGRIRPVHAALCRCLHSVGYVWPSNSSLPVLRARPGEEWPGRNS